MKYKKMKVKFKSPYNTNKKINYSWLIGISITTFFLALIISYISLIFMEKLSIFGAIIILLLIVLMGIFFDGLGIAVTASDETPFHSMAASKVIGAKESIIIIRNAGAVSNFFNDVIGDISGIISGSAAAAILIKINIDSTNTFLSTVVNLIFTAVIASLTIGGKAVGKEIALRKSNAIVYKLGIIFHYFRRLQNKSR